MPSCKCDPGLTPGHGSKDGQWSLAFRATVWALNVLNRMWHFEVCTCVCCQLCVCRCRVMVGVALFTGHSASRNSPCLHLRTTGDMTAIRSLCSWLIVCNMSVEWNASSPPPTPLLHDCPDDKSLLITQNNNHLGEVWFTRCSLAEIPHRSYRT